MSKKPTKTSWTDPDDAPDLATPEWRAKFPSADLRQGNTIIRRGRPLRNPIEQGVAALLRARRLGTEEAKAEADLALGDLTREQLREVLARAQQAQG
jgi:hypothetical protein